MSQPVDFKYLTQAVTTADAPGSLSKWCYGKSRVRLVRVYRSDAKYDRVKEVTVEILLESDVGNTYVTGDNSRVIPTDTMKNTTYYVAKEHFPATAAIEEFGIALAKHFINTYDYVWHARVSIIQHGWQRAQFGGDKQASTNTFIRTEPEQRTAVVTFHRSGKLSVQSGFQGLTVLKAGGSSFEGFPRCKLTTLPEAKDRTLCTAISCKWTYLKPTAKHNFDSIYAKVRDATIDTVCTLDSGSVQQVIYDAAQLALRNVPELDEVETYMPNIHLFLYDINRFGLDNNREVYYPTSDPHGSIYATIKRKTISKL